MKKTLSDLMKERSALERASKVSRELKKLLGIAETSMESFREFMRTKKRKEGTNEQEMKNLEKRVSEDRLYFNAQFRAVVLANHWQSVWKEAVLKEYVRMGRSAVFYYLSEDVEGTRGMASAYKKRADEFVRGWQMLGMADRRDLPGPTDIVNKFGLGLPVTGDDGTIAILLLVSKLKEKGALEKKQAEILEMLFSNSIAKFKREL